MTSLPSKVIAGEVILCADKHEIGRLLETLSLAESITAEAVAMNPGAVTEERPRRMTCTACRQPVVKVLRDGRWSVRLRRGWVSWPPPPTPSASCCSPP